MTAGRALQGRRAVVTGVTSGIGEALTVQLAAAGAVVIGIGRDRSKLDALQQRVGPGLLPFCADLASPDARRGCIDEVRAALVRDGHPAPSILVNNAAECIYDLPTACTVDRWRSLLEVNLLACIELTREFAPSMGRSGHVVNISSVTARFVATPRFAPYALSKAALDHFTESLRLELAPHGTSVTTIAPGLVDTPIYDKVDGFEATQRKMREQVPEWLTAADVAEAILWTLTRPEHVTVADMVLLPRGQAR